MREPEYTEGQKATLNFEEGMKALFKVSKDSIAKPLKKRGKSASSGQKSKPSDKD